MAHRSFLIWEFPTPNQRIIKRHERKVGKASEAVSDESCNKALSLEKARSKTDADHTAKSTFNMTCAGGNESEL